MANVKYMRKCNIARSRKTQYFTLAKIFGEKQKEIVTERNMSAVKDICELFIVCSWANPPGIGDFIFDFVYDSLE